MAVLFLLLVYIYIYTNKAKKRKLYRKTLFHDAHLLTFRW